MEALTRVQHSDPSGVAQTVRLFIEQHPPADVEQGDDATLAGYVSLTGHGTNAARALEDFATGAVIAEAGIAAARRMNDPGASLVSALNHVGLAYLEQGRLTEADLAFCAAITALNALPDNAWARPDLRGVIQGNQLALAIARGDEVEPATLQMSNELLLRARPNAQADDPLMMGISLSNEGAIHASAGRVDEALVAYAAAKEALALAPASAEAMAGVLLGEGQVYARRRDPRALPTLKAGWDLIRTLKPHSRVALLLLSCIAELRLLERDMTRARSAALRALELYDEMRENVGANEVEHAPMLDLVRSLAEYALYATVHIGMFEEPMGVMDRVKARLWLDTIAGRGLPASDVKLREMPIEGFDCLSLQFFVGTHAVFLHYAINEQRGNVRLTITPEDLRELIDSFRIALMSSSRLPHWLGIGKALWNALFSKVKLTWRCRLIVVSPDGPLWWLPFDALPCAPHADTPLNELSPTVTAPSFRVLAALQGQSRTSTSQRGILVVCDPTPSPAGFAPLSGTLAEAEAISRQCPPPWTVRVLARETATKTSFLSQARDYSHLHIACHCVSDFTDENAYLTLADVGGTISEATVSLSDIVNCRLRADLVFLSVCSASVGKPSVGEGMASLARAFILSGCRAVITALWPLPDEEAVPLVNTFYEHLFKGVSPAESLRAARTKARSEGTSSRTWGSFQVLGDGDHDPNVHQLRWLKHDAAAQTLPDSVE
jgi:CHAT domain-containing protein